MSLLNSTRQAKQGFAFYSCVMLFLLGLNRPVVAGQEKQADSALHSTTKQANRPVKKDVPDPDRIIGIWTSPKGLAHVEIFKKDNQYFGKIIDVKRKNADGSPILDVHNPNIVLRKTSLLDLEVLKNFEYLGEDTWANGTIYDPKNGNTYACKITFTSSTELRLRGYVLGIPLLGRTEVFTK